MAVGDTAGVAGGDCRRGEGPAGVAMGEITGVTTLRGDGARAAGNLDARDAR